MKNWQWYFMGDGLEIIIRDFKIKNGNEICEQ